MWYNVVIRSNVSNREIARFDIVNRDQALNIAWTLMQSRNWASCYVVGYNAEGGVEFAYSPPGTKFQFPIKPEPPVAPNFNYDEIEGAESSGLYVLEPCSAAPSK